MNILVMKIQIRVVEIHSLKEKRMIVKSILQKLKNKFNVSVAEVSTQDNHKLITIGVVSVASDGKMLDIYKERIVNFIEDNVSGELVNIEYDTENY